MSYGLNGSHLGMTLGLPGGSLGSDLGVRWGLHGSYLVFHVSVYGFLFGNTNAQGVLSYSNGTKKFFDPRK